MIDSIENLAPDFYGVYVENEIDERRLLYLVNTVGENKLRATVKKVTDKYPGSKPFISKLLGWYRIVVPVSFYAPVEVPVYRVYALILLDHSKVKIGFSKNWVSRASNFHITYSDPAAMFDIHKSFSVLVGTKISEARELEHKALAYFRQKQGCQTTPPSELLMFGASGHKEWFVGNALAEIKHFLCNCDLRGSRSNMTLREALASELLKGVSLG